MPAARQQLILDPFTPGFFCCHNQLLSQQGERGSSILTPDMLWLSMHMEKFFCNFITGFMSWLIWLDKIKSFLQASSNPPPSPISCYPDAISQVKFNSSFLIDVPFQHPEMAVRVGEERGVGGRKMHKSMLMYR